jgi:hypothetical protein
MTKQFIPTFIGEIVGRPVQLCDACDLAIQFRGIP